MINKISKCSMIISIVLAVLCPVIYNIIGSKILSDGTLEEPFYLVGFMYLFLIIFIISTIVFFVTKKNIKKGE